MIRIYNTLTRKKEDLQTLDPNVIKMYVCGVTVYNDAHVGHAMSALVFDIIRRYLEYRGFDVRHVMNYTDVDDKIINRANQLKEDPFILAQRYIDDYAQNLKDLNILPASSNPRAPQTMDKIESMVKGLIDKGFAYPASNGDVYFRVTKDKDYGKLSGRKLDDMQAGARIEVEEAKEHPMDFALWKAAKPGEPSWESPWGQGRPGWHIECSAMSLAELGEQIDIHGGGEDLIFPPHENETAQSESKTGKLFARFWVHARFLLVEGEKMAKSAGNFFTVRDLILMGHKPSSIRFLLMSVPYRNQLNFPFDGLTQAANSVERLRNFKLRLETSQFADAGNVIIAEIAERTSAEIRAALDEDLNTARALGAIFDMVRDVNAAADAGEVRKGDVPQLLRVLEEFEEIFAVLKDDDAAKVRATVEWAKAEGLEDKISPQTAELAKAAALSDAEVERLVAEHSQARKTRDCARSDAIRAQLAENGIILENTKDGVRWKRK